MKKLLLLSLACLAGAAILMLTTLNRQSADPSPGMVRRVALLAENENGTYYMQLRQGAQDAADALNAVLLVEIIDPAALKSQLAGLADNGTAAVIVYAESDTRAGALATLRTAGIFTVTIGNDGGDAAILRDVDADAQSLADAAHAAGCSRALVVGDDADLLNALMRAWTGEIVQGNDADSARPGDCVLALTAEATKAALARTAHVPLFGVDTGESRATILEAGKIDGMLLPRPYAIGYRAVEAALMNRNQNTLVAAKLITPETMYRSENVDIVYPLIQ